MKFEYYFKKRWFRYLAFFLLFTLLGLIKTSMFVSEQIASNAKQLHIKYYLINEMTGSYTVLILFPLLLWFFNRFQIKKKNLLTHIPLYLFASIIFGISHTALMWLSRKLIYYIGNFGVYDYGKMWARLFMEYNNQIFAFITIWIIISFIRYVKENQNEKLKRIKLEEALTKARLQTLQMQLNPHFLFNTLNMISSTMYKDVKSADSMIANLSDLLRETLKKQDSEFHTFNEELKILTLYLDIMEGRFSDKLKVLIDIDPETKGALVPSFILQPLVENSIKYGVDGSGNIKIKIKTKKIENLLSITVQDNGPGIDIESPNLISGGVGIANIIERLEKLFGDQCDFKIENLKSGKGLQVIIYFPFNTNGK